MNIEDKQLLEVLEKRISQLEAQVALLQSHAVVNEETERDLLVTQNEDSVAQEELKSETSVETMTEKHELSQSIEQEVADMVTDNTVSDNAEQLSESDKVEDKLLEQVAVQEIQSDSKEYLSASSVNAEANTDASEEIKSIFVENTETKYTETASKSQKASLESRIGKKLFPIAGSILVIFAIVLFGSLIRPHLTNDIKAIVSIVFSVGVSLFGLIKMKKGGKFYKLYSAVAGCGVAASYISILISHFTLNVLPEAGLMAGLIVWIIAVVMLSRYKSKMFTYICYIGILIAAALIVERWNDSPWGIIVYLISISGLFAANFSRKYRQVLWFFIQFPIVMGVMAMAYDNDELSQCIIYAVTTAILIGQVWYYHDKDTNKTDYTVPTIFSFITMYFSFISSDLVWYKTLLSFQSKNHVHNIIFAFTLVALCIYYYRLFYRGNTKTFHETFWALFAPTVFVLPFLNYNTVYNDCMGHYLLPSIVLLSLGCWLNIKPFRVVGYIYLVFFSFVSPEHMFIFKGTDHVISILVWVFVILLAGFTYWLRKQHNLCDNAFLIPLIFWSVFLLCLHKWTDFVCAYMIAGCVILLLNNERVQYLLLGKPKKFDYKTLFIIFAAIISYMGVINQICSVIFNYNSLIYLSEPIVSPAYAVTSFVVAWGVGCWKKQALLRVMGYIILPVFVLMSNENTSLPVLFGCYLILLCAMIWWTIRHYTLSDKGWVSALVGVLFVLLWQQDLISRFEAWVLLALYVAILSFTPKFKRNLITGEYENKVNKTLILLVEALLIPGIFALKFYHGNLFIGHNLEGTKTVVTILLCLTCLLLSCINMTSLYRFSNRISERKVSLYTGLKYTLLLYFVLMRFSLVSYGISIVGILLSVVFV